MSLNSSGGKLVNESEVFFFLFTFIILFCLFHFLSELFWQCLCHYANSFLSRVNFLSKSLLVAFQGKLHLLHLA